MMRNLVVFLKDEDGMGTVEIILIIVVLIALVAIFKEQITKVVNKIITAIGTGADGVIN
jgi:Flp pilus assembly pilin Flp